MFQLRSGLDGSFVRDWSLRHERKKNSSQIFLTLIFALHKIRSWASSQVFLYLSYSLQNLRRLASPQAFLNSSFTFKRLRTGHLLLKLSWTHPSLFKRYGVKHLLQLYSTSVQELGMYSSRYYSVLFLQTIAGSCTNPTTSSSSSRTPYHSSGGRVRQRRSGLHQRATPEAKTQHGRDARVIHSYQRLGYSDVRCEG